MASTMVSTRHGFALAYLAAWPPIWLAAASAVWLSAVWLSAGPTVARSADAPTEYVVSYFNLGAVDQPTSTNAALADELNSQEWCRVAPAPVWNTWNEPPRGVDAARWLSVVTVGFHEQAEAYAFQFDGPRQSVRLAAHVAHRKHLSRGALVWSPPYVALANGLRANHEAARRAANASAPRPLLQYELIEHSAPARPRTDGKAGFDDALTLGPEKVFPPLRAIVLAAACDAGWAPLPPKTSPSAAPSAAATDAGSPGEASGAISKARVEIRVLDQACAFRIVFQHAGRETIVEKQRVPWEEYHVQLTRLFRSPLGDPQVFDFVRLGAGPVGLLAAADNRLACLVDDELTAIDATNGQEAWRVRIAQSKVATVPKKIEQYAVRRASDGRPRLIRWTRSLAEFSLADGQEQPLAPLPAGASSLFDVDDESAVVAQGVQLAFYKGGKQVWSVKENYPITCGPCLEADRVLAGNEQGELFALSRVDGRELWRVQAAERLHGGLARAGRLRVAFTPDDESCLAFDPQDGSRKWSLAAGDALLQPPLEFAGDLIVVTKQNRIVRVNAATGAVISETIWPTWLLRVEPLSLEGRTSLFAADLGGRVARLTPNLTTDWESRVSARLTGGVAALRMPAVWTSAAQQDPNEILAALEKERVAAQPFVVTTDVDGFLYKLSLEGAK